MGNKYIVGIIPEDKQLGANLDADKLNKGKTGKTFTVGLSPTGNLPFMHRWFCWWMSDEEEEKIRKDFDPADPMNPTDKNSSKIYDLSKGWDAEKILEENGLKRIQTNIFKMQK